MATIHFSKIVLLEETRVNSHRRCCTSTKAARTARTAPWKPLECRLTAGTPTGTDSCFGSEGKAVVTISLASEALALQRLLERI